MNEADLQNLAWNPADGGTFEKLVAHRTIETPAWYVGLVGKGYLAGYEEIGGANAIGTDKQIRSGTAATGLSGSWVADRTTIVSPVTTNAADITALMVPRLDAVYLGSAPVSSLTGLNDQLDNLFQVAQ